MVVGMMCWLYLVLQWTFLDLVLSVHMGVPSGIVPFNSTRLLVELVHPVQRDNHITGVRSRGQVVIAAASHPRPLIHHDHAHDNGQIHRNAMPNSGHGSISNQSRDRDLILKPMHEQQTHVAPSPMSTVGHSSGHTTSPHASHVDLPGEHGNSSPFPVVHRASSHDGSHDHGSRTHHRDSGQMPSRNLAHNTMNGFSDNHLTETQGTNGQMHGQLPLTQHFHATHGVPSTQFVDSPTSTGNTGFTGARADVMPTVAGMEMTPPFTFGQSPGMPQFVATPGHMGMTGMQGPLAISGNMGMPGSWAGAGHMGMAGPLATPGTMGMAEPLATPGTMGMAGPLATPGTMGMAGPLAGPGTMGMAGPLARTRTMGMAGSFARPGTMGMAGPLGRPRTMGMAGPLSRPGTMGMAGSLARPGTMGMAGPLSRPGTMGMAGPLATPGTMGMAGPLARPGTMEMAGSLARPFMRPFGGPLPFLQGIPPQIRRTLITRRLMRMGQRMGRLRRHLQMLDSTGV